MNHRLLLMLLASILGGGVGALGGWTSGYRKLSDSTGTTAVVNPSSTAEEAASSSSARPTLEEIQQAQPGQRYDLLAAFLNEANAQEIAELAVNLLGQPGWSSNPALQEEVRLLMRRWAAVDPTAALAAATEEDGLGEFSSYRGTSARALLLEAWGRTDSAAALAAAEKLGSAAIRCVLSGLKYVDPLQAYQIAKQRLSNNDWEMQGQVAKILAVLAERDPQQAITLLAQERPMLQHGTYEVVLEWMQRDAEGALAWARSQPPGFAGGNAWNAILSHYQDADPAKARELLLQLPHGKSRTLFARQLATDFARTDPAGAQAWAGKLSAGLERTELMVAIAATCAASDVATAWRIMEETAGGDPRGSSLQAVVGSGSSGWSDGGEGLPGALQETFRQLAMSDPAKALMLSLKWANPNHSDSKVPNAVLAAWLKSAPEAALATLKQLPDTGSFQFGSSVGKWLCNQPVNEVANTLQQFSPKMQAIVLGEYINVAGNRSPSHLLDMVSVLPAEHQASVIGSVGQQVTLTDSSLWADSMAKFPPAVQENFYTRMLSNDRNQMTPAAMEAVAALAANPAAANGIGSLVQSHLSRDPERTSEWVKNFPAGPGKDRAAAQISTWLRRKGDDPEASFLWAATIQSPQQQESQVRDSYRQWEALDEAAAKAALQASQLPENLKSSLAK